MGLFGRKKEEETEKTKVFEGNKVTSPPNRALPPLPSSNRTMEDIKSTISPSAVPELTMPETEQTDYNKTQNIPEMHQSLERHLPMKERSEPIFVKINKFKEASENFDKIKDKVEDIEDMLTKIKEIKDKEDEELGKWEHEVQMIKKRIQTIDDSLFEKI